MSNTESDTPMVTGPFGLLNIDKPPDATSRDVVNRIQKLVRPAKCGHAGTLDPMATGVLLVCVGPATRLIDMLQQRTKIYWAEFLLGSESDTDDSTGRICDTGFSSAPPSEMQLKEALKCFTGVIEQVPPAFSAVHVQGQRAYSLARRGLQVPLTARSVRIDRISLLSYEWPRLTVEIECGSGTYIRSVARDLGRQLGCGGLMSRLQRTAIGEFTLNRAVSIEQISSSSVREHLLSPVTIIRQLPKYLCTPQDIAGLKCGRRLPIEAQRLLTSEDQTSSGIQSAVLPLVEEKRAALNLRAVNNRIGLIHQTSRELLGIAELMLNPAELQPKIVFC